MFHDLKMINRLFIFALYNDVPSLVLGFRIFSGLKCSWRWKTYLNGIYYSPPEWFVSLVCMNQSPSPLYYLGNHFCHKNSTVLQCLMRKVPQINDKYLNEGNNIKSVERPCGVASPRVSIATDQIFKFRN
jgi:hypothetical protein